MDLESEPEIEAYERQEVRNEIEVGREYGYSSNIYRLIHHLIEGDEITVSVYRKGNPTYKLWVTDKAIDNEAIAIELSSDDMYYLLPNDSTHPGSMALSEPWLRTWDGMDSRGEIEWLRVDELS